jgi:hypothetical protein
MFQLPAWVTEHLAWYDERGKAMRWLYIGDPVDMDKYDKEDIAPEKVSRTSSLS